MPALPLSQDQLHEAAALKRLFVEWQRARKESGLPSSQEAAAELMGFGQSALAQYLNGKIPLNVEVSVKFSNMLGAKLSDFTPSLAGQAAKFAGSILTQPISRNEHALQAVTNQSGQTSVISGTGLPKRLQSMVELELLSEREAALVYKFQISSDFGKDAIDSIAEHAERDPLFIVHDKAN